MSFYTIFTYFKIVLQDMFVILHCHLPRIVLLTRSLLILGLVDEIIGSGCSSHHDSPHSMSNVVWLTTRVRTHIMMTEAVHTPVPTQSSVSSLCWIDLPWESSSYLLSCFPRSDCCGCTMLWLLLLSTYSMTASSPHHSHSGCLRQVIHET